MKPRTAIIILFILVLIGFGTVFYLYETRNNKQPASGQNNAVKQLTPAEKKAQTIELMEDFEKNQASTTKIQPKEKKKQETTKLMQAFEKNSQSNNQ